MTTSDETLPMATTVVAFAYHCSVMVEGGVESTLTSASLASVALPKMSWTEYSTLAQQYPRLAAPLADQADSTLAHH